MKTFGCEILMSPLARRPSEGMQNIEGRFFICLSGKNIMNEILENL